MTNSNAGVDGSAGYTFQKACVMYLIFDNFEHFKSKNYFIYLEHHDDFLFVYLNAQGIIEEIEAYQAKKATSDWSTDQELGEIIGKLTLVGESLRKDDHPKLETYSHKLTFITNRNISLCEKHKGRGKLLEKIQASNTSASYKNLDEKIRENIKSKIVNYNYEEGEIDNVFFQFIDLAQTNKSWQERLLGKASKIFGEKVKDHAAALRTLKEMIDGIELTYNDGGVVSLGDKGKRIGKVEIDSTFKIINETAKSYDFWRNHSHQLKTSLNLKLPIQRKAYEHLENCFDYFKDINNIEHRRIYKFVEENTKIDEKHVSDADCIVELYDEFLKQHSTNLEDYIVAFSVIAAYVETRDI